MDSITLINRPLLKEVISTILTLTCPEIFVSFCNVLTKSIQPRQDSQVAKANGFIAFIGLSVAVFYQNYLVITSTLFIQNAIEEPIQCVYRLATLKMDGQ